jgi:hypothetical protein
MRCKRYLPPEQIETFLNKLPKETKQKILGFSVNGLPIHLVELGKGERKILMWSQMHGNESTTTKALFDLIPWLIDAEQEVFLDKFKFYIILQLNPDGAKAYTRANANQVDLNRDAIDLSQPESRVLRNLFDEIHPDYALNLHGQRTIYGAGSNGKVATLSFLAPSADSQRSITPARAEAMKAIVAMYESLQNEIPQGIGRYDDHFNPNCVGDSFTQAGVPTLLFEAGHFPNDYPREQVKKYVFKAYQALLHFLLMKEKNVTTAQYFKIPENKSDFVDLIVSQLNVKQEGIVFKNQQVAIQYIEVLNKDAVEFKPSLKAYGKELPFRAHRHVTVPANKTEVVLEFSENKIISNPYFSKLFSVK